MVRELRWIEPLALALVPVALALCAYFQTENTALLTTLAALAALLPFFMQMEFKRLRARDVMPVVVLSALAVVGRWLCAPLPNFMPVTAIVIVAGLVFGRQSGFLTGALSALVSNFYLGQGPWTPWQMYAWGVAGYLAGLLAPLLAHKGAWRVYLFGACASLLYGAILDSWFVISYVQPFTIEGALAAYAAGLAFNLSHIASTLLFLLLAWQPWRRKLERIKIKYGILEKP
ncbi:Predicted membrane protein [uncultured Clostridium sp.]|nr:Predicted membrane protein [uncultured Clostridium sp.]